MRVKIFGAKRAGIASLELDAHLAAGIILVHMASAPLRRGELFQGQEGKQRESDRLCKFVEGSLVESSP
jgi:hypothetical protein